MSQRLPDFLRKQIPKLENIRALRSRLAAPGLKTVCEEARCPNIGECYAARTCTFLILGNTCTRNCAFCGIAHGRPLPPDPAEPERIAAAVQKLGLRYAVITSVTRDDLADGGAGHFVKVITECRMTNDECRIEVLIPDFHGNKEALRTVLNAQPFVLNHNIETVPRLYPAVRPQADYQRSLQLLRSAKDSGRVVYTKSGFMVGLGETQAEIEQVLRDLKDAGCDLVTIGQYLPPSKDHIRPERYVTPEEFRGYETSGQSLGLRQVFSGPFVRSSYHAEEVIHGRSTAIS